MAHASHHPRWSLVIPVVSWIFLLCYGWMPTLPGLTLLLCAGLMGCVACAVHHAEVIALKVGEPFGTLVLALSVTAIEVALIVSMMLAGGDGAMRVPRDTIFAAVMIILNGIIGLSLLVGGLRHKVQSFNVEGMTDAVCTTAVIVVLAMLLPNYVGGAGPVY